MVPISETEADGTERGLEPEVVVSEAGPGVPVEDVGEDDTNDVSKGTEVVSEEKEKAPVVEVRGAVEVSDAVPELGEDGFAVPDPPAASDN